ncbi:MAG: S8 family peptidase [Halolamina sp.]
MSSSERLLSRRTMLETAGNLAAVGGLSGVASAHGDGEGSLAAPWGSESRDDHVVANVGYEGEFGRESVRDVAHAVRREFGFDALTVDLPAKAIDALRAVEAVRYIEPNDEMHALDQSLPWGVDRVAADVVHEQDKTGAGIDVAVLDTGIDADHPDLRSSLGTGAAAVECSDTDCTVVWDDDNGHGTHCAGIAGAIDNSQGVVGVSPRATLHAVKVLTGDGAGSVSDIAAGIEWVADRGYDVANMSFGGTQSSSVLKDAVQYAHGEGVLLVAAAGNDGGCSDCVNYPAAYDEVVAVSATTRDDSLASFSSTGPEVEFAAPGKEIRSTVVDGYAAHSGTSMAAPHVTGAAAQLMADGRSRDEARTRLRETAADLGLSANEQGAGLPDLEAAFGIAGDTPVVTTREPEAVGTTSARFVASLNSLGGADEATVQFAYGEHAGTLSSRSGTVTRAEPGLASVTVDDLSPGTSYEVRAEVSAADGDAVAGEAVTFSTTTDTVIPRVESYVVSGMGDEQGDSAEITADWRVADADGDLAVVTVDLFDDDADEHLAAAETDVSGTDAEGTDRFSVNAGNRYQVRLTVEDGAGNSRLVLLPVAV